MLKFKFKGLDDLQLKGVKELSSILEIELSNDGIEVTFTQQDGDIRILWDGKCGEVFYSKKHHIARCIGLLVEKLKENTKAFGISENPCYDTLGFMLDCSRNAVVTFDTFKEMTCRLALMGYSMIQLYTEDSFEMKEYPYFGYMRPRLTKEDIRQMDEYTKLFGIELTPCIQTLAHLSTFLRWADSKKLCDTEAILLVDSPDTYEFIECEFKTMAECFTSRRINIGLDEAHALGLGRYLDTKGYKPRLELMLQHCKKVFEIARKYGFRPMMWSDMFFRVTSPTQEYYHIDKPMDAELIKQFPDDVELVYWDYYNYDEELVDGMFRLHKDVTDNVVFAPGAWKWSGFSPNNRYSEKTCRVQHKCCRKNGIREVIVTAWGDNGNLASNYSMMPNLQLWAELCYRNDSEDIKKRFRTCMSAAYDEFYNLDMPGMLEKNNDPTEGQFNPELYLLYQDVLMGLFDKHVAPYYKEHFAKWAKEFDTYAKRNSKWAYLFELERDLCRVLELKCDVGIELYGAYNDGNRDKLTQIANETLPEIISRMRTFCDSVTEQWNRENQIIGLDSLDLKLGGVLRRLEVSAGRLNNYLSGKVDKLDELERERLPFMPCKDPEHPVVNNNVWVKNVTANVLS
ncbi:MAG: beta-N-acetylhexosaminidase [Oscillospiraceae bacterium]|nr:beta-N-acetylhexosaminidase [Oscillospiraceae bacterium]